VQQPTLEYESETSESDVEEQSLPPKKRRDMKLKRKQRRFERALKRKRQLSEKLAEEQRVWW